MNYMSMARLRYALVLFVVAIVAVASNATEAVAVKFAYTSSCINARSDLIIALANYSDVTERISKLDVEFLQLSQKKGNWLNSAAQLAAIEARLAKIEVEKADLGKDMETAQEAVTKATALVSKNCRIVIEKL